MILFLVLLILTLLVVDCYSGKPRCYSREHVEQGLGKLFGEWRELEGDSVFQLRPDPVWGGRSGLDYLRNETSPNLRYFPHECFIPEWNADLFAKNMENRKLIIVGDSIGENIHQGMIALIDQNIRSDRLDYPEMEIFPKRGVNREEFIRCSLYVSFNFTLCLIRSDCSAARPFISSDRLKDTPIRMTSRDIVLTSTGRHHEDCYLYYQEHHISFFPRSEGIFGRVQQLIDSVVYNRKENLPEPIVIFHGHTASHWVKGKYDPVCQRSNVGEGRFCNQCGWPNGQQHYNKSDEDTVPDDFILPVLQSAEINYIEPFFPVLLAGPDIHRGEGDCVHIAMAHPLQAIIELMLSCVQTQVLDRGDVWY